MAKAEVDPIVAALAQQQKPKGSHSGGRVNDLFAERPQILEAIRVARSQQRLSYDHIASAITRAMQAMPELEGESISGSAIKTWCDKQGI